MKNVISCIVAIGAALLLVPGFGVADEADRPVTVSPVVGVYLPASGITGLKTGYLAGLRVDTPITKSFGIEGDIGYLTAKRGDSTTNAFMFSLQTVYPFLVRRDLIPFVTIGLGGIIFDQGKSGPTLSVGVGAKYLFTKSLELRGDLWDVASLRSADNSIEATVGVCYLFGAGREERSGGTPFLPERSAGQMGITVPPPAVPAPAPAEGEKVSAVPAVSVPVPAKPEAAPAVAAPAPAQAVPALEAKKEAAVPVNPTLLEAARPTAPEPKPEVPAPVPEAMVAPAPAPALAPAAEMAPVPVPPKPEAAPAVAAPAPAQVAPVPEEAKPETKEAETVSAKPALPEATQPTAPESKAEQEAPTLAPAEKAPAPEPAPVAGKTPDAALKPDETAAARPARAAKVFTGITFTANSVVLNGDGSIGDFKAFTLRKPARLVIDLGRIKNKTALRKLSSPIPGITQIRIALHRGKVRVILDSDRETFPPYRLVTTAEGLQVVIANIPSVATTPDLAGIPAEGEHLVLSSVLAVNFGTELAAIGLSTCPDQPVAGTVEIPGKLLEEIFEFNTNRFSIRRGFQAAQRVARFMKNNPKTSALVLGHADNTGRVDHNVMLSQKRAESVKNYLTKKFGIAPARIGSKAFGCSSPAGDNTTAEGRRKNRMTVTIIAGTAE